MTGLELLKNIFFFTLIILNKIFPDISKRYVKGPCQIIVIDFTTIWCGPCRHMEPIINDFAAKYTDVEFIKIGVDELADVAQEYGVQAMPTFVLIKQGKVVDKVVVANKDGLQKKIENNRA
nr:thioredoxin H2-like [Nicotiana tomentosiformis]